MVTDASKNHLKVTIWERIWRQLKLDSDMSCFKAIQKVATNYHTEKIGEPRVGYIELSFEILEWSQQRIKH